MQEEKPLLVSGSCSTAQSRGLAPAPRRGSRKAWWPHLHKAYLTSFLCNRASLAWHWVTPSNPLNIPSPKAAAGRQPAPAGPGHQTPLSPLPPPGDHWGRGWHDPKDMDWMIFKALSNLKGSAIPWAGYQWAGYQPE